MSRAVVATGFAGLAPDLTGVRALSVDAFDTLILRAVDRPSDVFALVGARAAEARLVPRHLTPSQFAVLRRTAEEQARRTARTATGSNEVSLEDIYAAWPGGALHATALAELELETERELVHVHPDTLELVRDARARGMRTALVSDTYLSRPALRTLIDAAGVPPDVFDLVLTSADAGCSKHDGGLYAHLLAAWPDLVPGDILHLGDHPHADLRQAGRAGLATRHHDTGRDGTISKVFRLETLRHRRVLPELASLRATASHWGARLESRGPGLLRDWRRRLGSDARGIRRLGGL